MKQVKIGILREGKIPPDHRVPLTPKQCKSVEAIYPDVQIVVQPSPVRRYTDDQYREQGITVQEDLSDCEIIFGVKEVNVEDLIPGKKFIFFSHTFKKQPYNRALLQAILDKRIQLIDYEIMKDKFGKRLIGFGRFAGIVGCYNAFRTYGLKHGLYELKPANQCHDRKEVEAELQRISLPNDLRIVLTGYGRVGHGAREIIDLLPIKEVTPDEFLNNEFGEPVFTHLEAEDYYAPKSGKEFDKKEFYSNPQEFVSTFARFLSKTDMYIPCHYWDSKAPFIISKEDLEKENVRLSVVADISCDINGPIASTIRASKISDPIYGYNRATGEEDDFRKEGVIAVMAVDNLPCELPLDASEDFGNELIKHILPSLLKDDPDDIIGRASETTNDGKLTERYAYLQEYVEGK